MKIALRVPYFSSAFHLLAAFIVSELLIGCHTQRSGGPTPTTSVSLLPITMNLPVPAGSELEYTYTGPPDRMIESGWRTYHMWDGTISMGSVSVLSFYMVELPKRGWKISSRRTLADETYLAALDKHGTTNVQVMVRKETASTSYISIQYRKRP